jgi:hypothetical protein
MTVFGRPRVAHALRLTAPAFERPVTVVHLHGLRDPAGKGDTPARRDQAHQLAALVTQVRGDGDVTVVCGDLNLLPDSETFDVLRGIGLFDLVGTADTRTTRYRKPTRHASYLLVSHPEAVRALEVVRAPEVSDHRALTLRPGLNNEQHRLRALTYQPADVGTRADGARSPAVKRPGVSRAERRPTLGGRQVSRDGPRPRDTSCCTQGRW